MAPEVVVRSRGGTGPRQGRRAVLCGDWWLGGSAAEPLLLGRADSCAVRVQPWCRLWWRARNDHRDRPSLLVDDPEPDWVSATARQERVDSAVLRSAIRMRDGNSALRFAAA